MGKALNLINGLQDSLRFSNWPILVAQRLFCRAVPIVVYEWKKSCESSPLTCLSRFENIVMELHPALRGESKEDLFSKLQQAGFTCQMTGHIPDENGLLFWTRNPKPSPRLMVS